jgi:hypothetical protein
VAADDDAEAGPTGVGEGPEASFAFTWGTSFAFTWGMGGAQGRQFVLDRSASLTRMPGCICWDAPGQPSAAEAAQ